MQLRYHDAKFYVTLKSALTYEAALSNDLVGSVMKINNALEEIPKALEEGRARLAVLEDAQKSAWEGSKEPFPKEAELREKQARLTQLNLELESTDRSPVRAGEKEGLTDGAERASEDGGAPAPEPSAPKQKDGKSSILQALRGSRPPAPEPPGPDKALNKEAAL